jgi:hypothetical protein
MTKNEGRLIAVNVARLPDLLRAEQPDANALVQMRSCKGVRHGSRREAALGRLRLLGCYGCQ